MEAEYKQQCHKKGLWTEEEDRVLLDHIKVHGIGQWNRIPKLTGLNRCGKSCRLRWLNYLSPNVKRGCFSEEEEDLIIRLHKLLGNRWSLIAGRVPGRTDNQVKNHWNTHLRKKLGFSSTITSKKKSRIVSKKIKKRLNPSSDNQLPRNPEIAAEGQSNGVADGEDASTPAREVSDSGKPGSPSIVGDGGDNRDPCENNLEDYSFAEFLDGYFVDLVDQRMYWQCF